MKGDTIKSLGDFGTEGNTLASEKRVWAGVRGSSFMRCSHAATGTAKVLILKQRRGIFSSYFLATFSKLGTGKKLGKGDLGELNRWGIRARGGSVDVLSERCLDGNISLVCRGNIVCVRVRVDRFTKTDSTIGISFVGCADHTGVNNLASICSKDFKT
eukprot:scaffold31816_cov31-Attheya_sp.AAC.1